MRNASYDAGGADPFDATNFYDDIDKFEIGENDIGEIGLISDNKLIQGALEGFISIKRARVSLLSKIEN